MAATKVIKGKGVYKPIRPPALIPHGNIVSIVRIPEQCDPAEAQKAINKNKDRALSMCRTWKYYA